MYKSIFENDVDMLIRKKYSFQQLLDSINHTTPTCNWFRDNL